MDKEKEKLVLDNIKLAYKVALKYQNNVRQIYELEDAKQVCLEGLVIAAENYDSTKGIAFSTYAYTVMRNHLITPSLVHQKKTKGVVPLSLDGIICGEEKDCTLLNIVGDAFDLEGEVINNNQLDLMYEYINELPQMQRDVLLLRCKDKTFASIARKLNISIPFAQQQYQKGINKLRYKFKVGDNPYE